MGRKSLILILLFTSYSVPQASRAQRSTPVTSLCEFDKSLNDLSLQAYEEKKRIRRLINHLDTQQKDLMKLCTAECLSQVEKAPSTEIKTRALHERNDVLTTLLDVFLQRPIPADYRFKIVSDDQTVSAVRVSENKVIGVADPLVAFEHNREIKTSDLAFEYRAYQLSVMLQLEASQDRLMMAGRHRPKNSDRFAAEKLIALKEVQALSRHTLLLLENKANGAKEACKLVGQAKLKAAPSAADQLSAISPTPAGSH